LDTSVRIGGAVSREGFGVRDVSNEEGNRLLRIVRRSSGSVVTWRRAQMVLLSVHGMDAARIAKVTFTSPDRVREVVNNFNEDGFESLYPKYAGGRPPTFTLPQRQQIKKIALSRPADHGLPFSTWKQSNDPDFEVKKNRVLELYDIAEGKAKPRKGDPKVVLSVDEFGPLNLLPRPGQQWAPIVSRRSKGSTSSPRRRRRRATYKRTKGVRHMFGALDMNRDKLYGHVKANKNRTTFLAFCRYLRSLYPPDVRIAIAMDNDSPHLSTKKDGRVGEWAAANNAELAYVPTNASFLNRIECHFAALRYFALDGTDHRSHDEQNSMIRPYIMWRNRHIDDEELRDISLRAKVA
jgi:transposase